MVLINPTEDEMTANGPKGIRGWLALMGLGMVFGPLRTLGAVVEGSYSNEVWAQLANHSNTALGLGYFETFFSWFGVAFSFGLTYLFFKKSRHFPKLYIAYGIFTIVYVLIDYLATALVFNLTLNSLIDDDAAKQFGGMLPFIPWTLYLLMSRRAKNTFVE